MRLRITAVVLLLSNLCVATAQPPTAPTIRRSELSKHPLEVGQLRLTVEKFKKWGTIQVKLENLSDAPIIFNPHLLSLVDKGNVQVDMIGFKGENFPTSKVLPGATLKAGYWHGRVNLPARLFYDGKELAIITE